MTEIAPRSDPVAGPDGSELMTAGGLLAAESVLLAAVVLARLPWGLWLLAHLALIGCVAVASWRWRRAARDVSPRALTILTALIGGPVGALLVTAALLAWRRQRPHPERLAAWYDRIALAGDIDGVTRLADTVAMGRAVGTSREAPRPFTDVMMSGSLADRQAALGLIARHFSPAYAPALQAALVTGEPMVRVQAAAVATRVRAELKSQMRAATAAARNLSRHDEIKCAELICRLRGLLSTGMIEDDDLAAAEAEIDRLVCEAAAAPPPADADVRRQLETELLRVGDFATFRALRSAFDARSVAKPDPGHG